MKTYTLGPWSYSKPNTNVVADAPEFWIGANGLRIADIRMQAARTEASARLIAAAPELLEALQEAVRCLSWHDEKHGVGMDRLAVKKALDAIKKATQ